jgi:hypothetical protein
LAESSFISLAVNDMTTEITPPSEALDNETRSANGHVIEVEGIGYQSAPWTSHCVVTMKRTIPVMEILPSIVHPWHASLVECVPTLGRNDCGLCPVRIARTALLPI